MRTNVILLFLSTLYLQSAIAQTANNEQRETALTQQLQLQRTEAEHYYKGAVTADYGIRYLFSFVYDVPSHRTYKEDRLLLVSPHVTLDMSYLPIGTYLWQKAHITEAAQGKKDGSLQNHLTPTFFFYHPQKGLLRETARVISQEFLLRDTLCKPTWDISPEERMIDEYSCRKATATIGGRRWTAWFTNDLPLQAAPRHLQGLPGVILEAKDDKGEIEWIFNGIVNEEDDLKLYIKQPAEFSPLSSAQAALVRKTYALTPTSYVVECGILNTVSGLYPEVMFPAMGLDACRITNPIETPTTAQP